MWNPDAGLNPLCDVRPVSLNRRGWFCLSYKDRVWGLSVSRGRGWRLPWQTCSVPPSRPLIGCSHNWGKRILPIRNNWHFVARPRCPDKRMVLVCNKIVPQVWKSCSSITGAADVNKSKVCSRSLAYHLHKIFPQCCMIKKNFLIMELLFSLLTVYHQLLNVFTQCLSVSTIWITGWILMKLWIYGWLDG